MRSFFENLLAYESFFVIILTCLKIFLREVMLMEEHSRQVKSKILNSAKKLLMRNGYKKTTIRQIERDSGVLIGSIYHFFKNKDNIFEEMIAKLIERSQKKIEESCAGESSAFVYAAMIEVELCKMENDEIARDIYFSCYTSKTIFADIVRQSSELIQKLFRDTNFSQEQFKQISLFIGGSVYACISELYITTATAKSNRRALIRHVLKIFKVPNEEIESILEKIDRGSDLWKQLGNELVEQSI